MADLIRRLQAENIYVSVFALEGKPLGYDDEVLDLHSDDEHEPPPKRKKRKAKALTDDDRASESKETRSTKEKRPEKRAKTAKRASSSGKDEDKSSTSASSRRSEDDMDEDRERTETSANGDCLYAAINIALGNPADMDRVLRELVTDYAIHHPQTIALAALDADSVIELLSTPGEWAGDSGDLAPAVLASAIGRNIVVVTRSYVTYVEATRPVGDDILIFLQDGHYTVAAPGTAIPKKRRRYSVKLESVAETSKGTSKKRK